MPGNTPEQKSLFQYEYKPIQCTILMPKFYLNLPRSENIFLYLCLFKSENHKQTLDESRQKVGPNPLYLEEIINWLHEHRARTVPDISSIKQN